MIFWRYEHLSLFALKSFWEDSMLRALRSKGRHSQAALREADRSFVVRTGGSRRSGVEALRATRRRP